MTVRDRDLVEHLLGFWATARQVRRRRRRRRMEEVSILISMLMCKIYTGEFCLGSSSFMDWK